MSEDEITFHQTGHIVNKLATEEVHTVDHYWTIKMNQLIGLQLGWISKALCEVKKKKPFL